MAPVSGLHDRPDAAQLVGAVADLLAGEVRDATTGTVQFQARVAANVLRIVQRELATGAAPGARHDELLRHLGVADEVELAAAIRVGSLDDRLPDVVAAVTDTVRMRLAVDHPGYDAPAPGQSG
jgi:hypothetical protein